VSSSPWDGRANAGFGGDEGDAEAAAQGDAPVADRAGADMVELLERVEDGPPFRDGLTGHQCLECGDQRGGRGFQTPRVSSSPSR
jgi:hypothetical protein